MTAEDMAEIEETLLAPYMGKYDGVSAEEASDVAVISKAVLTRHALIMKLTAAGDTATLNALAADIIREGAPAVSGEEQKKMAIGDLADYTANNPYRGELHPNAIKLSAEETLLADALLRNPAVNGDVDGGDADAAGGTIDSSSWRPMSFLEARLRDHLESLRDQSMSEITTLLKGQYGVDVMSGMAPGQREAFEKLLEEDERLGVSKSGKYTQGQSVPSIADIEAALEARELEERDPTVWTQADDAAIFPDETIQPSRWVRKEDSQIAVEDFYSFLGLDLPYENDDVDMFLFRDDTALDARPPYLPSAIHPDEFDYTNRSALPVIAPGLAGTETVITTEMLGVVDPEEDYDELLADPEIARASGIEVDADVALPRSVKQAMGIHRGDRMVTFTSEEEAAAARKAAGVPDRAGVYSRILATVDKNGEGKSDLPAVAVATHANFALRSTERAYRTAENMPIEVLQALWDARDAAVADGERAEALVRMEHEALRTKLEESDMDEKDYVEDLIAEEMHKGELELEAEEEDEAALDNEHGALEDVDAYGDFSADAMYQPQQGLGQQGQPAFKP